MLFYFLVPSAPPSDIIVEDMFDTKRIKLKWSPVPVDHQNGIILGYKIKYKMASQSVDDDISLTHPVKLPPNTMEYILSNLVSSATYDIQLLAYTSMGNGVAAKLVGGKHIIIQFAACAEQL